MCHRIVELIVLAASVAMYCSAQAPGDGDSECTGAENAPTYPDTVKNLMDSYTYLQLLPGNGTGNTPIQNAVWNDRSVDGNDATTTVNPTFWQQGAGGICRFQVRVCGWQRDGGQDNWLFTQHINQDFDPSIYNYQVEIKVEITYALQSCRKRFGCIPRFTLHNYITNTIQLPSTSGSGFMNTQHYNSFAQVVPPDQFTHKETFPFTLEPSGTGFYIAVRDNGTCVGISRIRVYRNNCQSFQTGLVLYPDAPAPVSGSENISMNCVDNAVVSGSPQVTCYSNGTWGQANPVCECRLGYENRMTECFTCPAGQYRSDNDVTCQQCPGNTEMDQVGAGQCECLDGYFRNDIDRTDPAAHTFVSPSDEEPSSNCTKPTSAPSGLSVVAESPTSLLASWSLPSQTGGRSDLYYRVEHSDPDNLGSYTGTVYKSGGSTSHTFTGLRPYTQYCIRVSAHNGVTDQDPDGGHLRIVEECIRTSEDKPGPVDTVETYCCSVVVWNEPERPNGLIHNYTIFFTPNSGKDFGTEIETTDDKTSFVMKSDIQLPEVPQNGSIFVTVRANNAAGKGSYSQPSYIGCENPPMILENVTTPRLPPTEPEPVQAISIEGDLLYWKRPPGRISHYVVKCYNESDKLSEQETKEPYYLLSEDKIGNFSIEVCSVLNEVQGNCSATLKLFRKDPNQLPPPPEPVRNISIDGLTLVWEKPSGEVSYYVVILHDENERFELETNEPYYKLTEDQRKYSVQVCAVLDGVRGDCSDPYMIPLQDEDEESSCTNDEGISQELIITAGGTCGVTAVVVGTFVLLVAAIHHWRFKRRFGPNREALTWEDYKINT